MQDIGKEINEYIDNSVPGDPVLFYDINMLSYKSDDIWMGLDNLLRSIVRHLDAKVGKHTLSIIHGATLKLPDDV